MEPGRAARAFLLIPTKGRVLADFIACETGAATWLECQGGSAAIVLELLAKYYFGQDVAFTDRSAEWRVLALVGPDAGRILTGVAQDIPPAEERTHEENRSAARRSGAQVERCRASGLASLGAGRSDRHRAAGDPRSRRRAGLRRGVDAAPDRVRRRRLRPRARRRRDPARGADRRRDRPREGCYPGQEVIARLHVRGRPARHLMGLRFDGARRRRRARLGRAGQSRRRGGDRERGEPGARSVALAYVHRDYCAPGTRLTSDTHSAEVAELPLIPPTA